MLDRRRRSWPLGISRIAFLSPPSFSSARYLSLSPHSFLLPFLSSYRTPPELSPYVPPDRMLQSSGARLLMRTTPSSSTRATFSSPTLRCLHSSRTPRTTHSLHSAVQAERQGAEGARWGNKKRFAAAAGAVAFAGLGAAFLNFDSSDCQPLLSPSVNPNDPLSALEPSILGKTSAHLTSAALSDLVRQWVVYAVSEQSLLVSAAPWIVEKLQWANDNVPLVGPAVWAVFSFVSCFSSKSLSSAT